MSALIKLTALAVVLVLLAPILGANTEFGRIVSAALEDAAAFCDRRPEACHQTAEIARETRAAVLGLLGDLADEEARTLTVQDRALAPVSDEEPAESYGAYSANNAGERP